jgi:hypothetical protein
MVFIGFSTPRLWNPLSALIRAMTRSRVSHTFLLVEDPMFELRLVLEAHSTGFRLVSLTRFVKDNKIVAIVEPSHPVEPGLPRAGEWLGEKFDLLGLFGIFVTLLARYFRQRPWRNPFPTPSALFCSEAVIKTLKAAGYPGSAKLGEETTTPAEVLAFFECDPDCVIYGGKELKLWSHLGKLRRAARQRRDSSCPSPTVIPAAAPVGAASPGDESQDASEVGRSAASRR